MGAETVRRVTPLLMRTFLIVPFFAVWASATQGSLAQSTGPAAANPGAVALQDFRQRIASYVRVHRQAAATLKPLKQTSVAKEITDYQEQLASRLRSARQNIRQGEIFTLPIATEFRRLIGIAMQGKNGTNIRASLAASEPVRMEVAVNSSYPSATPLQSSPPTMLMNLPKLPAELEYRIVGEALILRDVKANIIVDFMANAIPGTRGHDKR